MSNKRVSIGYVTSLLGILTSLLNNLWLMRSVALEVDKSEFGIYLLTVSVVAYIGLSQLGLDLASSQRIAESLARDDTVGANRIFKQLTWYNRTVSLAVVSLIAIAIVFVLFSGRFENSELIAWIIGLVGLGSVVRCFSVPATATLSGSQNLHMVGGINLLASLCTTLLAFVLLRSDWGILCLPAANAIVTPISLLALHGLRYRYCSWSTQPVVELWSGFGPLLRYSIGVAAAVAIGMIDSSSEPIIFQFCSNAPLIDMATYNIWTRFPLLTLVFSSAILTNAGPTLATKMEISRVEGLSYHRSILWLATAVGSSATIGLCIWLVPFMHHWVDGTYDTNEGTSIAIAMAAGVGFRALALSLTCLLYPLNKIGLVVNSYGVLVIVKIALGFIFVRISPVAGMAWASAIAALVSSLYVGFCLKRLANYSLPTLAGTFSFVAVSAMLGSILATITVDVSMQSLVFGIIATAVILGMVCLTLISRLEIFSIQKCLPTAMRWKSRP